MKLFSVLILLMVSVGSFAMDYETKVRCSGKTSNGDIVGVDLFLDSANRIVSMATFSEGGPSVIEAGSLIAPAVTMTITEDGEIELFTFQSHNMGLEFDNNVVFVDGVPELATLELGYAGNQDIATSEISCAFL